VLKKYIEILAVIVLGVHSTAVLSQEKVSGFYLKNVKKELNLEKKIKLIPSSEEIEKNLRLLSEEVHMAGTKEAYEVARLVQDKMNGYGINTELDEYSVYLPHPLEINLTMVEPEIKEFDLREKGWKWDKDSYDENAVIPFNSYSTSGNITEQLVYVNYGLPDDFKVLEETGIDLKGKIAIIRYGGCFRGVKVHLAEKHGAAGVILYSDPADDGYVVGDVYPRGPMRPPSGVQRGSIKYMFFYPGDPLTPGWGARESEHKLSPQEAHDLPGIPCIPISYGNAKILLENLAGPEVPQKWQGGLPFRYHIGPGPTKVNLDVKMEFKNRKIWNTVSTIEGTTKRDEVIVIGNHRDSWTFGTADPNSGTSIILELGRCFGKMLKEGFKPLRTIILATWDAEEFGIIGSTEWVEQHKEMLKDRCVLYLNIDTGVTGRNFRASATPSLRNFVRETTKFVTDPATGLTVYDVWRKNQRIDEKKEEDKIQKQTDTRIGILGSGSDYAAFYNHVGIGSMDWSFGGKSGIYHSLYDNFYVMSTFSDPGFVYHPVMVKLTATALLRLLNCDILPFDFRDYAVEIENYLDELDKKTTDLNLDALREKVKEWKNLCKVLNQNIKEELKTDRLSSYQIDMINKNISEIEKCFIYEDGIPGRPWYKHTIYASDINSGYGYIVLPGLQEAVLDNDIERAKEQFEILKDIFDKVIMLTREANNTF